MERGENQLPILSTYDVKCPHCHFIMRLVNNDKSPNYYNDRSFFLENELEKYREMFLHIDEFCMKELGTTYMQEKLREIYKKFETK